MNKGTETVRDARTAASMGRALDHFGRRWALRILWELRGEALTFRELRAACGGVSPSVLQRRLHELRALGVVERVPRLGYRLSVLGERLFPLLARLDVWSRDLPRPPER